MRCFMRVMFKGGRQRAVSRSVPSLLLAGAVCFGQQSTQATPPPGQAPPKGKVLFERHEPALTDSTPQTAAGDSPDEAPDPHPRKYGEGTSSSQRRARTTLHRRDASVPDAAAAEAGALDAQRSEPRTPSSSLSSSNEGTSPDPQGVVTISPEDRDKARSMTEADRAAVSVLRYDLDIHLNTHTGAVETRAQLLVKNSGAVPLARLPLRISGALQWESAKLVMSGLGFGSAPAPVPPAGKGFSIDQYRVPDGLDHTGTATEIALTLPEPLLPGKTLQLDLYYSGTFAGSTQRLTDIGAPSGRAALTDWDTVSDTFTGLRGLGNVLWYPVAGPTAQLRDGDAVTRTVEASRVRDAQAEFRLNLTLEYAGSRPDAAFFTGERQVLKPLAANADSSGPSSPADQGVVTAEWTRAALGPHTPSLFIVDAGPHLAAGGLLRVVSERADTAAAIGEAVTRIRPMLTEWLGAAPASPIDLIDLPVPGAAGFADGTLFVAPLLTGSQAALAPSLVQPLAAAWLPGNLHAPWLREGIPAFLQAVWIERTQGRAAALAWLLANAANASASSSTNPATDPPLAACSDAPCARGKAAYVLEMLRGMMGGERLQQALSGWRFRVNQAEPAGVPLLDSVSEVQKSETAWFELAVIEAVPTDIHWFLRDWIEENRGLPDLTIVAVAPRRVERSAPANYLPQQRKPVAGPIGAEPMAPDPRDLPDGGASSSSSSGGIAPAAGSWLVAVEVQNNGSAEAEVPVTVRAGGLTNTLPLRIAAHSRATVRVPFEAAPEEVLVNDGSVPEARSPEHRRRINNLPAAP